MLKKETPLTSQELEKLSSCFTLSDMEIFIFPELFYSLVLANICSPLIWEWKKDPWFVDIDKKNDIQKIKRVKQYIMDHFEFNLDLQTWGLTDKLTEVNRFKEFVDMDTLANSNALFGYHGDKYYFDIDIRRHFGLDAYEGDIIPYWKTETVEAMTAFASKPEYQQGAGECVSFACLYAAALFIVGNIPLEKIYLMATPLHSQNFIDIDDGVLTNNRRIITKNMWYNGTALSNKARRALENEQITMVSHLSGYVHSTYQEATIDANEFRSFRKKLTSYLSHKPDSSSFRSFLRTKPEFQECFQFSLKQNGTLYYLGVETIFAYEHNSKNSFSDNSKRALLQEIDSDELSLTNLGRTDLKEFENQLIHKKQKFACQKALDLVEQYNEFIHTSPRFPCQIKDYQEAEPLKISTAMSRTEILEYLHSVAPKSKIAHYTLYTYRQMDDLDWTPFLYASFSRSPICKQRFSALAADELYQNLAQLKEDSIYSENRLATPDEACNFDAADGIEKAIIMATCFPGEASTLQIENEKVEIVISGKVYHFQSNKKLSKKIELDQLKFLA